MNDPTRSHQPVRAWQTLSAPTGAYVWHYRCVVVVDSFVSLYPSPLLEHVFGITGVSLLWIPLYLYTPPPSHINTEGEGLSESLCMFIHLSVCPCVRVCQDDISCTAQPFLTELGMVVYYQYHEVECHAQNLVHCLQCQVHREGLNARNHLECARCITHLESTPPCILQLRQLLWWLERARAVKGQVMGGDPFASRTGCCFRNVAGVCKVLWQATATLMSWHMWHGLCVTQACAGSNCLGKIYLQK